MIRLRALQLATAAWKTTLEISGKFRPRTWLVIAALHGCIAVTALWAYDATTVSPDEIPPVATVQTRYVNLFYIDYSLSANRATYRSGSYIIFYSHLRDFDPHAAPHLHFELLRPDSTSNRSSVAITNFTWLRSPTAGQSFSGTLIGNSFIFGGTEVFFAITAHEAAGLTRPKRTPERIVVLREPCEAQPLLCPA